MPFRNRTTLTPLLMSYGNKFMYLHVTPQGYTLFDEDNSKLLFQSAEPLLLAQGIMTDSETVHLVVLRTNGELCYSLISKSGTSQTSLLAKLDVRSTIYRRLFLFPQDKMIHIFYAYSHQSIPGLWRIEHRFWNGTSWNSVHMGEVVHPREPLYHVNMDNQGNLHILTITSQGNHALLFTNRFNGTFHIWGTPTETLKISGEVSDMTALITSDNVQYLFWVTKTNQGQFELCSAQQSNAHVLTSPWQTSPAPIKTFSSPWRGLGGLEFNGVLWLLVHTNEEILMQNNGTGWRLSVSHTPIHHPLLWVHKSSRNNHQTYWLEDQANQHAPAYYRELGFNPKKQNASPYPNFPDIPESSNPTVPTTPPPVPAFHPHLSASNSYPPPTVSLSQNKINTEIKPLNSPEIEQSQISSKLNADSTETFNPPFPIEIPNQNEEPKRSEMTKESTVLDQSSTSDQTAESGQPASSNQVSTSEVYSTKNNISKGDAMLSVEDSKLECLISTVAHLEEENKNMNRTLQNVLLKFDQILGILVESTLKSKQDSTSSEAIQTSFDELEPVKEAMANLEKETQSLSQVMRIMLNRQEENDSSLENIEVRISQLQGEQKNLKNKGGFWNKWMT